MLLLVCDPAGEVVGTAAVRRPRARRWPRSSACGSARRTRGGGSGGRCIDACLAEARGLGCRRAAPGQRAAARGGGASLPRPRASRRRRTTTATPGPTSGWSGRSDRVGLRSRRPTHRRGGHAARSAAWWRARTRWRRRRAWTCCARAAPRSTRPSPRAPSSRVVYPHMTSVGGDAFWLIYDAGDRRACATWARRAAPRASARHRLVPVARASTQIPLSGILPATLTVPGAVDTGARRTPTTAACRSPATSPPPSSTRATAFRRRARLAHWTAGAPHDARRESPEAARIFLPGGRPPRARPATAEPRPRAHARGASRRSGRDGFYEGEAAAEAARYARRARRVLRRGGLRRASAREWEPPLHAHLSRRDDLRDAAADARASPCSRCSALVEPFDARRHASTSGPDAVHLLVQAKQLAFHDRDRFLADPDFVHVPVERAALRAPTWTSAAASSIPRARSAGTPCPSAGSLAGDTVYVAAVDAEGNAASLIQSVYGDFGVGASWPGRTGVVLQNRGAYFSLDPAHPNRLEPGKRPLHTLIASLAFTGDRLWQVLGCMGADGQPQIHLQAYTAHDRLGPRRPAGGGGAPLALRPLRARRAPRPPQHGRPLPPGHASRARAPRPRRSNRWEAWNESAGHAHGITIDPATGDRSAAPTPAATAPRSATDGSAVGY